MSRRPSTICEAASARATGPLGAGITSTPCQRSGRFWMLPLPPHAVPTLAAITRNAIDGALTTPSHTTMPRWNEVVRPVHRLEEPVPWDATLALRLAVALDVDLDPAVALRLERGRVAVVVVQQVLPAVALGLDRVAHAALLELLLELPGAIPR